MENNIIVSRLFLLIQTNPSVEKKKLADIYRNQYLPVSDRDIEKSLQYLVRDKCVFAFRDRRGVSSWWEAKVVENTLSTITKNHNCSTRELFGLFKEYGSKLDIVGFQKLLMTLRDGGYVNLIHSPAPSHWVLNQQKQVVESTEKGEGVLLCA